jgi:formate hydrogenlyase subunit 3/multisubunit Na+/H+ antiporter MnhD subunit
MASLALPGMSGFVAELMVFVGFATSDAYNPVFKVCVVFLAAVGVILTPIYLLSMLPEILDHTYRIIKNCRAPRRLRRGCGTARSVLLLRPLLTHYGHWFVSEILTQGFIRDTLAHRPLSGLCE